MTRLVSRPALVTFYQLATRLAEPVAPLVLRLRGRKEESSRARERRGFASIARPDKPVIWLHGASIGELMSALTLARALRDRGAFVLLTSGTKSSAGILSERIDSGALGPDIAHQYVPLDFPGAVARFLDHWQPQLALFMEQEIWPNMLVDCRARSIPGVLVNGRLSARSFGRWQKRAASANYLLGHFALCLAQSKGDAERFTALGASNVVQAGNLKLSVAPAARSDADLDVQFGERPVWLAASTHAGEERIIAEVHQQLKQHFPDILTIIAPRHAERASEILTMLGEKNLVSAQRSRNGTILPETDIYLADTFGELSAFFASVPLAFIGGSLVDIGGHTPVEAIVENCAVIRGPYVSNFREMYETLSIGSICVTSGQELAGAVQKLLDQPGQIETLNTNARACVAELSGALDATLSALTPYLSELEPS